MSISNNAKIAIVQNVPTQFDVPLYHQINQSQEFKLTVYYTQTHLADTKNEKFDSEIGRSPQWDHLQNAEYDRYDLTLAEANHARLALKKILSDRPDFVLLSGFYPRLHAKLALLLKLNGIPIGLRSDNALPHCDLTGLKGTLKRLTQRYWLRLYDTWHPVGTLAHDYLKEISGISKPAFFFPYNVDNEWFATKSAEFRSQRNLIRQSLGIAPDAYVVLGIMKWHPREDPLTLVDAFRELHHQNPKTALILVGDGELRSAIEQRIKPFQTAVALPGYVPYSELPKFYGISDIFVHPAINECWGVSVNEALASGLPVIASEGVGSRIDLIIEGQNGFTFPKNDVKKLARILVNSGHNFTFNPEINQNILNQWSYRQSMTYFVDTIHSLNPQGRNN